LPEELVVAELPLFEQNVSIRDVHLAGLYILSRTHADKETTSIPDGTLVGCTCGGQAAAARWTLRCIGYALARGESETALSIAARGLAMRDMATCSLGDLIDALYLQAAIPHGGLKEVWQHCGSAIVSFLHQWSSVLGSPAIATKMIDALVASATAGEAGSFPNTADMPVAALANSCGVRKLLLAAGLRMAKKLGPK